MRLVVKQSGRNVNEFRFTRGPIYIGRHTNSQVFLPGRSVSRQHAVIYVTTDGKWVLEDLDSANKTYLNSEPIRKVEIKTGDTIGVTDYTIDIDIENGLEGDKPVYLEDTLVTSERSAQTIIRKLDTEHAPDMKLPARRAKDFVQATEAICKADNIDEILQALVSTALRQFAAFHCWCALRSRSTGPMGCYAGKQRDGKSVQLNEIKLRDKITEAAEKGQFVLLPKVPAQRDEGIQSVMIAPIIGSGGCFGVVYIDNALDHENYSLSDLDYLVLLSIHTATVLKNF